MTKKPDKTKKQKMPKPNRVLDERDQERSSIKNLTTGMSAEQSDSSRREEEEAVRRVSALLLRQLKESYKKSG